MKTTLALLSLLVPSSTAGAQLIQFPFPFPRTVFQIYVPALESETSSFAYLQESDAGQTLGLARLTQAFPVPTAVPIATLVTENGDTERISDLYASPANRWLAVYTFQDQFTGFVDHNLTFFDMITGASLGLRNEHAFTGLNQAVLPSARLEEFKENEAALGVPPEELAALDYAVVTEGADIPVPGYQWNADGTFSLTFELDVEARYPEGDGVFIGTEAFTINIVLAASGITTVDFGDTRAPATFPSIFNLTPVNGPSALIRFESRAVRFRGFYFNFFLQEFVGYYYFPSATMTDGNIPRRYRSLL